MLSNELLKEEIKNLPSEKVISDFIKGCSLNQYTNEYYKCLYSGEREYLGIQTGFKKLDFKLKGLRGLCIIAGVPKAGKTSFILQLSFQVAQLGTPIIFYSLEMTRPQLNTRILSRLSGLDYIDILLNARSYLENNNNTKNAKFNKEEINQLLKAEANRKATNNFYIRSLEDHNNEINFVAVQDEIMLIKELHKSKEILIVIDHLQVFQDKSLTRLNQLEKENILITEFNKIQKETDATIVLISQKNKAAFDKPNTNDANKMMAVKGSVDLVYLASLIMTLDTVETKDNNEPGIKEITLNLISRDTPEGDLKYKFKGGTYEFSEVE